MIGGRRSVKLAARDGGPEYRRRGRSVMHSSVAAGTKTVLEPRRGFDLLGVATLVGLVLIGLAGWWLLPWFVHLIKHQDCLGSGRIDC